MKQIKILSLGDEFACTAQGYLPKIAKCDSVGIVAGAVFAKGMSLRDHVNALKNDVDCYTFIYNNEGSVRFNTFENFSAVKALDWLNWDYVVVQQCISLAADKESYITYLAELCEILKERCPNAAVVLNEPYAKDAREACIAAIKNSNVKIVFPVGEAWHNAEKAGITNLTADGHHTGRTGEFLSAAVWYEVITGNDMTKNSYRLPFVESEITARIKSAVHEVAHKYSLA